MAGRDEKPGAGVLKPEHTFRRDEIVSIAGRNGQVTDYPKIGGRLRLMHEDADTRISITSEIIVNQPDLAVIKSTVTVTTGTFEGLASASQKHDAKLAGSLLELAQTRSVARALRYAGYGVEACGIEELRPETESYDTDQAEEHAAEAPPFVWTVEAAQEEIGGCVGLDDLKSLWLSRNKTWRAVLSAEEFDALTAHKDKIKANITAATKEPQ